MSYFRLQANIISKKNQSAVASASYRSGEDLYSERDEEMKSFKTREVAPVSFLMKPDHAPDWALDREKLWNKVEKVEKAWNAQLAREVLIALPVDLTEEQQNQLVQSFVQKEFVDAGMVADVSIHRDKTHNPHAHIMLTVRPFNEDGSWGNKKERRYEFDENGEIRRTPAGQKIFTTVSATDWNERETLVGWRLNYAEAINQSFKEHGIEKKVSALSFEEQGLEKIPKVRLDRREYQYVKRMEAKGLEAKTFYHQLNLKIRKTNAEIKQLNEKLTFLSAKQSVQDIQSVLHRHTAEVTRQLDTDYQKSLRFMAGRLKGEVTFKTVHNQLEGLYRWEERTLKPKQLEVKVRNAILNASHTDYQERNVAQLRFQGFTLNGFLPLFTDRLAAYETLSDTAEKETATNETVTVHAERAYRVQSLIVHNTFNELYPDIDDRYQFNDRTTGFKSDTLEAMKNGDWQHVAAPEEMDLHLQIYELNKACAHAEKASDGIRIQSLIRNKLGAEKENLLENGKDVEAIYETSVKLNTSQQLIERYEEKAILFDKQLNELLHRTFPNVKEEVLGKVEGLPLAMKTDLLKHAARELSKNRAPSLKDCLRFAQKEQDKREQNFAHYRKGQDTVFYRRLNGTQQAQSHFPTGKASTDLLDQLVRQAAQPNAYKKETGRLDKLSRKGKNTRMRRYLGLEIEL